MKASEFDPKTPILKSIISLGEITVKINNMPTYGKSDWHFKFSDIPNNEFNKNSKWIKLEYWNDDKTYWNTANILENSLKTMDDILYYILYYLLERLDFNPISSLGRYYDKYIYLNHTLVKYFGLNFVCNKVYQNSACLSDEAVKFIISTLIVALSDITTANRYYRIREIKLNFINDEWFRFEELKEHPAKYKVWFFEYIFFYFTLRNLLYKKEYRRTISSNLFKRIGEEFFSNYNIIKIKQSKV